MRARVDLSPSASNPRGRVAGAVAICGVFLTAEPAVFGVEATVTSSSAADRREPLKEERLEWALLPAINYNSDLGFGFGAIGTLVRFDPDHNPFRWRLQASTFFSLRIVDGAADLPVQSHFLSLDRPGLASGNLRIFFRTGFLQQTNVGYYGLGSNAPDENKDEASSVTTEFGRSLAVFEAAARIRLWSEPVPVGKRRLELGVGATLEYTWFDIDDGSRLGLDRTQAASDETLRGLLFGTNDHALLRLYTGLLWDTRDREFDPHQGAFHELSVRVSPGIDASLDFAGFALITRFFLPLYTEYLTLALRTSGDGIVGDAPFYHLSQLGAFEPISAPGGSRSLRGVLQQRFHGRLKLLQTFELRGRFLPFRISKQRFLLGAVGFVDLGRVWGQLENARLAVLQPDGSSTERRLDNSWGDIEVGLGGGVRLRWGETFIIRLDFGYAPTTGTTGLYIDIGDAF